MILLYICSHRSSRSFLYLDHSVRNDSKMLMVHNIKIKKETGGSFEIIGVKLLHLDLRDLVFHDLQDARLELLSSVDCLVLRIDKIAKRKVVMNYLSTKGSR